MSTDYTEFCPMDDMYIADLARRIDEFLRNYPNDEDEERDGNENDLCDV